MPEVLVQSLASSKKRSMINLHSFPSPITTIGSPQNPTADNRVRAVLRLKGKKTIANPQFRTNKMGEEYCSFFAQKDSVPNAKNTNVVVNVMRRNSSTGLVPARKYNPFKAYATMNMNTKGGNAEKCTGG